MPHKKGVLLSHDGIYSSVSLADFNLRKIHHSLQGRRSQPGRHLPSLLCIWLQAFGFQEGKSCADETLTAAPQRLYCSACTLCVYTWHARQTPCFRAGTWANKRRESTLHNTQVWFYCFYWTPSSEFILGTDSSRLTTLGGNCSTGFWVHHRHRRIMEALVRHVAEYFQPWLEVWERCATRTCVWSFYFLVCYVLISGTQMQMKQSQFGTLRHMESNFFLSIIFMGGKSKFSEYVRSSREALAGPDGLPLLTIKITITIVAILINAPQHFGSFPCLYNSKSKAGNGFRVLRRLAVSQCEILLDLLARSQPRIVAVQGDINTQTASCFFLLGLGTIAVPAEHTPRHNRAAWAAF